MCRSMVDVVSIVLREVYASTQWVVGDDVGLAELSRRRRCRSPMDSAALNQLSLNRGLCWPSCGHRQRHCGTNAASVGATLAVDLRQNFQLPPTETGQEVD